MHVQTSTAVPRGQVYFAADFGHPEMSFADIEAVDGTVIYCHPDDEQTVRDTVATIGEQVDVAAWATAIRRRKL